MNSVQSSAVVAHVSMSLSRARHAFERQRDHSVDLLITHSRTSLLFSGVTEQCLSPVDCENPAPLPAVLAVPVTSCIAGRQRANKELPLRLHLIEEESRRAVIAVAAVSARHYAYLN
jgi:hypothetical protein